jgi:RNA polymerase sigma-70 factor (ECF subfamily)
MSQPDPPDGDLIRRFREGDEGALRVLLARYERRLIARIERDMPQGMRRRVSSADILQDAYLVATRRLDEFEDRGEGAFLAWLGRIADLKLKETLRHHMGTEKRRSTREVPRGARPDTQQFKGREPTPSQVAVGNEMRLSAHRAMASLPDDYRRVLQLVQNDGFTLRQAADEMGRSYEAVKKLYRRALTRFAEAMDQAGRG